MSTGGLSLEVRRAEMQMRRLHAIVQDTRRTLVPVADIYTLEPDMAETVYEIGSKATGQIALVILGQNCNARARLVNALLGSEVLPTCTRDVGWRWIRLQYGASKQVHLNLGNSEFEIVEPLVCHHTTWDTLPIEDLKRRDPSDLNTIMDIELNNAFLKDGLRIIIPPDIGEDVPCACTLLDRHKDFYAKRASILKSTTPIFVYALSCIGPLNLSPEVSLKSSNYSEGSENSEDKEQVFENMNSLYYMKKRHGVEPETVSVDRSGGVYDLGISLGCNIKLKCDFEGLGRTKEGIGDGDGLCTSCSDLMEYSVFSMENLLDLKQVNDIHPNCQIHLVLFADSQMVRPKPRNATTSPCQVTNIETEATESTEDVFYNSEELPESDWSFNGNFDSNYVVGKKNVNNQRVTDRFNEREMGFQGLRKGIEDVECGEEPVTMNERRTFMRELLERLEAMGYTQKTHSMKSLWFIMDDVELMKRHAEQRATVGSGKARANSRRRLDFEPDEKTAFKKCVPSRKEEPDIISAPHKLQTRVVECFVNCIRSNLLVNCTRLSEIHISLLQHFILASFDMAREMQVVPKRIQYVAVTEQQLYQTLHEKFSDGEKKEELVTMMQEVLLDMKVNINSMDWRVDDLPCHDENLIANSVFYSSSVVQAIPLHCEPPAYSINQSTDGQSSDEDAEEAVSYGDYSFGEYDIVSSPVKPSGDVTEITVSADCKEDRNLMDLDGSGGVSPISFIDSSLRSSGRLYAKCTSDSQVSTKQASLDVQKTVLTKLGDHISRKLVMYVDCLRDSYYGTLQRCLESLESTCRTALERPATEAMRQLLTATQVVDLQDCASFSVLRTLMEHLRRFFYKLSVASTGTASGCCCPHSPRWRRQVALDTVQSLSGGRLARLISRQVLERLRASHERYQAALAALEAELAGQLHRTEDVKLAIRKKYAPAFARLCLESTSMCDLLKYGAPELGSEIGRGQYGVVYSCKRPWAGHEPCAVKSVMPADERHFNELAMEFFYTRSIPPHERIVRLWGSVVESSCGGGGPAVLLVSERLERDLYCAVRRSDLSFVQRMRVAVDIVEGIRYLHSLGLIHRDIKMKNVLLDTHNRAKLTDLGFCVPEALMSGSVVGTPIHMAPELLSGDYDGSVDVYAFGILFWYVCAGHVNLPSAFEVFHNKEQLWSKVRKGLRPERLPQFRDECWNLMESCWAAERTSRPLLGDVQPVLERILEESIADEDWQGTTLKKQNPYSDFMTDMLELS